MEVQIAQSPLVGKTLMQALLDAGYPREQCFSHRSDLYVFVNDLTTKVVREWYEAQGFTQSLYCTTFTDNVTGEKMYDCAFSYDPYWEGDKE